MKEIHVKIDRVDELMNDFVDSVQYQGEDKEQLKVKETQNESD